MYVVRFVRKDGLPDEEYFYWYYKDAKYHFDLFAQDISELYSQISVNRVDFRDL